MTSTSTATATGDAMGAGRNIHVIVNGGSGSGTSDLDEALAILGESGLTASVTVAAGIDEVLRLAEAAAAEGGPVVIGGGDGTLSAALPVLLKHRCTLGILPLGTANDLARSLEIPFDIPEAARIIVAGHTRAIDIGTVNGRPFLNVASIGIGTEVARRHTGERKRLLGVLNYPLCWYEAFRDFRPKRATLHCDGKSYRHRYSMLAIGNGRFHGGGLMIDQDAQHDDGLLKVYYLKSVGVLDLLHALYSLRMGTLRKDKRATVLHCRTAEIVDCPRLPINVDGEIVETTPATFGLLPKALNVLVPDPAKGERPG